MIAIQDKDKNIIAIRSTLTKAMDATGIPKTKYSYIREKLSKIPKTNYPKLIKYKSFIISKW